MSTNRSVGRQPDINPAGADVMIKIFIAFLLLGPSYLGEGACEAKMLGQITD